VAVGFVDGVAFEYVGGSTSLHGFMEGKIEATWHLVSRLSGHGHGDGGDAPKEFLRKQPRAINLGIPGVVICWSNEPEL
jgi:hypothetical protein